MREKKYRVAILGSIVGLLLVGSGLLYKASTSVPDEEGAELVKRAAELMKARGDDITGFEQARELMDKAGKKKGFSKEEIEWIIKTASMPGKNKLGRGAAIEALTFLAVSGYKQEARTALDRLMSVTEPDAKTAMINALYAARSEKFVPYAEAQLKSQEEYVSDTAKLVLGIYRTKGFTR